MSNRMGMLGVTSCSLSLLHVWRFAFLSVFLLHELEAVVTQEQYLVKTIKSFEKGVFFYDIEVDRNHPDLIYATDLESHCIRVYNNRTGEVKIFAGQEKHGYQDGYRVDALFYKPRELCQTLDGSLYVVDSGNFVIRKIDTFTGNVTTVAGNHSEAGSKDGAGSEARFTGQVVGIKCLADGTLLVADPGDPSKEGGGTLRQVACPGCVPAPSPPPPQPSPTPTPTPTPTPPKPTGTPNYAKFSIAANIILAMLLAIIVIPKFLHSDMNQGHMGHHRSSSIAYDYMEDGAYMPLMPDFGITAYPNNSITSVSSSRAGGSRSRNKHRRNNSLSQRFAPIFAAALPHAFAPGPPSVCESLDESTMATQGTNTHVPPSYMMPDDGHDSLPPTPYHPEFGVQEDLHATLLRRSVGHRSDDDFMYHEFDSEVDLESQPATPYANDTEDVTHVPRQHPFGNARSTSGALTVHMLQQHNMMGGTQLVPAGPYLTPAASSNSNSALPPLPSSRPSLNAPGRPPLPRSSTRDKQKTPSGSISQHPEEGMSTPVRRPPAPPPPSPFATPDAQRESPQPMRDLVQSQESPQPARESLVSPVRGVTERESTTERISLPGSSSSLPPSGPTSPLPKAKPDPSHPENK